MAKSQLRQARAERQQFPGIVWERTCKKCGVSRPETEEFFYSHPTSRRGLLAKCKNCVDQENKESFEKQLEREPEKVRALGCERTKRYYYRNLEESRRKSREAAARARQDPERRARINMRKRAGGAGLTPEEFEAMIEAQGRKCAICEATEPGAKTGWNIDHCHKANEVRFILCPHCNRGLGAFKDNPAVMRRAADILERWQEGKDE